MGAPLLPLASKTRYQEHTQAIKKHLMLKENLHSRREAKSRDDRQLMLMTHNLSTQDPASVKSKRKEMHDDPEMQRQLPGHKSAND